MGLDVFLQILWSLECLSTEITLVRLQGNVNTNVRGDVITLNSGGTTGRPSTSQVEVVGALAAYMTLTDMVLYSTSDRDDKDKTGKSIRITYIEGFGRGASLTTMIPLA